MKTINNFERLPEIFEFKDEGNMFMFFQILKRRKDNPDMNKSEKLIDSFYVYSWDELEKYMPHMIRQAESNNARVYVRSNLRDDRKVALRVTMAVARCIHDQEYQKIRKIYTSVCGTYSHEKNKKWVVDIDIKNEDIVFNVMNFIRYIHNKYKQTTYWLKSFETINGYHVITSPFNLSDWNKDAGLNASVLIYANLK